MSRLTLLALGAWLGLFAFAAAQDRPGQAEAVLPPPALPQDPLPRDAELPPQPVALPPETHCEGTCPQVAPVASAPAATGPAVEKIEHLRRAADHLEAAGRLERARELRRQAAELATAVARKLEQIKSLQAEIDALAKAPPADDAGRLVQLQMHVIEVARDKAPSHSTVGDVLKQLTSGSSGETIVHGKTSFRMALRGQRDAESLLAKLRQSRAIKVLAEPTLLTTSGRPASFCSGGEIPVLVPAGKDAVAVEFKKIGLQIDALPVLCEHGLLRLEIRPRVSAIDKEGAVKIADLEVPRLRTREIDVAVEIRFGQSLVLSGLADPADPKDKPAAGGDEADVAYIFVVTPALVDADAMPAAVPQPTAVTPGHSWWRGMWFK